MALDTSFNGKFDFISIPSELLISCQGSIDGNHDGLCGASRGGRHRDVAWNSLRVGCAFVSRMHQVERHFTDCSGRQNEMTQGPRARLKGIDADKRTGAEAIREAEFCWCCDCRDSTVRLDRQLKSVNAGITGR